MIHICLALASTAAPTASWSGSHAEPLACESREGGCPSMELVRQLYNGSRKLDTGSLHDVQQHTQQTAEMLNQTMDAFHYAIRASRHPPPLNAQKTIGVHIDKTIFGLRQKYKGTVGTLFGKGNGNSSKGNGKKKRQMERPERKDQRLSTADRQQRQDGVPQGAVERWTAPCSASTVSPIAHAIPVISKQFRIYAGSVLPSSIVLIGGLILEPAQRVPGQYALAVDAPAAYCHWSSDSQDTPAARALHPDRFVATYTCNRSNGALLHSLRGDFGSALLT